ncbi:hypothetical protein JHK82_041018 [Glycine max]|nr:hypothetical protein JHK86_041082 [Glycine max]KAG4955307.1 hypothetical protein JHK85_041687 [Glycine max]KAG5104048.1 hypothetical protein JHK82_041018 [Glycine max]KAG5115175.1 hypothetical protein JHK84_041288 [Glycine max]
MELSFYGEQSMVGYKSVNGASISAPVSPDSRKLEKSYSIARSRHESMRTDRNFLSQENVRNQLIQFELLLNRNICGCHLWSGSRNIRDEF